MVDNRSAKLKAQVAANRLARKYADGGNVVDIAQDAIASPQTLPVTDLPPSYQDPKTQALQEPEVHPEDLLAGPVMALGRAAGPALVRGAGTLLADEAGAVPLMSSRLVRGAPSLEPIQRIQQFLGHEVLPTGTASQAQADALRKSAEAAHAAGKLHLDDLNKVLRFVDKPRPYAEGGEVEEYAEGSTPAQGMTNSDASSTVPSQAPQEATGINVVSPEGELVSIPPEHVQEATQNLGYRMASTEEVQSFAQQQKYGTPGQQAIAGLEGLAHGVAGPLATGAETMMGVKPEDIRGREEANPWTHSIASGAGFVGSALAGTGEAAVLGAVGKEAALSSGFAHLAPAVGEAAAEIVAKPGFINQVSTEAIKGAFETALFQGGEEMHKAFIKDPNTSAETSLVDIGLSTLMGGLFGAGAGGIVGKFGKLVTEAAPTAEETFVSGADKALHDAGDLKTTVALDPSMPKAKKEGLLSALNFGKRVDNFEELEGARNELGAPTTPGFGLKSPLIHMQLDALTNSPYTFSGNKVRTAMDEAYTHADNALQTATTSANGLSKDQLGQALQTSLTSDTRAAYAPVKAAFDAVAELHPNAPVTLQDVAAFGKELQDIKEVKLGPSMAEGKLARQVMKSLENVKNADDLSTIRNQADLKDLGTFQTKDPLSKIKGVLRDRLQSMQDDAISRYAKSFPRNDEAGAMMQALIDQNQNAKQMYKPYIRKVGELSEWLGKGKIAGTEDALRFMNESLSASDVSSRLFSASKDPQFLRFFSKNFPEQFAVIRDYQRMALRDSATTGTDFSAKIFFNKFNKLEPEVQASLFSPQELKKVAAAETYMREGFPESYNPSGTSHVSALRDAYTTPTHLLTANARDLAMENVIKLASRSPQAAQAAELAKATVAGDKLMSKALKSFFSSAQENGPAAAIPLLAHREKLRGLIDSAAQNPSKLLGLNDNNPMPEYAQSYAATSQRAVQYLSSLKPKLDPTSPLDSKRKLTPAEEAAYNRALDIAQQPLSVLTRMQQGTLTPADVTTIKTIYPNLYTTLSQRVMAQVVEKTSKGQAIPYANRLQLSLFLGQPLDSTMTGAAIMSAQAKGSAAQQPSQQTPKGDPNKLKGIPKAAQTPEQARESREQR